MKNISVTSTIDKPRETVFAAFTDFDQLARVLHSATEVTFVTPEKTGLGTKWVQVTQEGEETSSGTHHIIELTQNQSFTMVSLDSISKETMSFTFADQGQATQVDFRMEGIPISGLAKLASPFLSKLIKKAMQEDLDRMKAHIESQS
ncbi:hypothetical protein C0431_01015 [bacterium]|nr:hypothetical protein [bacterium]